MEEIREGLLALKACSWWNDFRQTNEDKGTYYFSPREKVEGVTMETFNKLPAIEWIEITHILNQLEVYSHDYSSGEKYTPLLWERAITRNLQKFEAASYFLPRTRNVGGFVSGGAIATAVDLISGFVSVQNFKGGYLATLRMDTVYHRPLKPGKVLRATCEVVSMSENSIETKCRIFNHKGKLGVESTVHFQRPSYVDQGAITRSQL